MEVNANCCSELKDCFVLFMSWLKSTNAKEIGTLYLILVPLLVLIELVSYLARAVSLGVILFANITAGHTLLKLQMNNFLTVGNYLFFKYQYELLEAQYISNFTYSCFNLVFMMSNVSESEPVSYSDTDGYEADDDKSIKEDLEAKVSDSKEEGGSSSIDKNKKEEVSTDKAGGLEKGKGKEISKTPSEDSSKTTDISAKSDEMSNEADISNNEFNDSNESIGAESSESESEVTAGSDRPNPPHNTPEPEAGFLSEL